MVFVPFYLRCHGRILARRPLERYIAVFVIFGVPAVAMATDYCSTNSGHASQDIVDCQHTCEMVSPRPLPTTAAAATLPPHQLGADLGHRLSTVHSVHACVASQRQLQI